MDDIKSMDADSFHQYWLAITTIEAREMLQQIKISAYPHTKTGDQSSLHKSLSDQAYPKHLESDSEETFLSPKDIAKLLGKALNG